MSSNRDQGTRISEDPLINMQREPLSTIEEESEVQDNEIHHVVLPNSVNAEPITVQQGNPCRILASPLAENKELLCESVIRLIVHTAIDIDVKPFESDSALGRAAK